MTTRLHRIHAILRDGQVPCALGTEPGLGMLLQAGSPDTDTWDVLVQDTGTELWVHDGRGVVRLPAGTADAAVADAVKFQVVQARADQGDPAARSVLTQLEAAGWRRGTESQDPPAQSPVDVFAFLDPLQFAERMFDAAYQFGNLFLTPQPVQVNTALWSPWTTVQWRYTGL